MDPKYSSLLARLEKTRYFNIRRSGTITCRSCAKISNSPIFHEKHVREHHPQLNDLCPFCQTVYLNFNKLRLNMKQSMHLKICCFLHKHENKEYRSLFYSNKQTKIQCNSSNSNSGGLHNILYKNTMLTFQDSMLMGAGYFPTVLQYEMNTLFIIPAYLPNNFLDFNNLLVNENVNFKKKLEIIKQFYLNYIWNNNQNNSQNIYIPSWFKIDLDKIDDYIEKLISNNTLEFHPEEQIDCHSIRVLSLHWRYFYVFKCKINLNIFLKYLNYFEDSIKNEEIYILRYMKIESNSAVWNITSNFNFIGIIPKTNMFNDESIILKLKSLEMTTIDEIINIDMLIDECVDMAYSKIKRQHFPNLRDVQITKSEFEKDDLSMHDNINLTTNKIIEWSYKKDSDHYEFVEMIKNERDYLLPEDYYKIFLCELNQYAKIYFYSQTRFGCVRAFDRLFQKDSLIDLIKDVIRDNDKYYIYYSSFNSYFHNFKSYIIRLAPGLEFANEEIHTRHAFDYTNKDIANKFFFLNSDNYRVVTELDSVNISIYNSPLALPNCLFGSTIKYFLTPFQKTIYNVSSYHAEKIKTNNIIPIFDDIDWD